MGLVGCALWIVIISADREIYNIAWAGKSNTSGQYERAPIPLIGARLVGLFDHFIRR